MLSGLECLLQICLGSVRVKNMGSNIRLLGLKPWLSLCIARLCLDLLGGRVKKQSHLWAFRFGSYQACTVCDLTFKEVEIKWQWQFFPSLVLAMLKVPKVHMWLMVTVLGHGREYFHHEGLLESSGLSLKDPMRSELVRLKHSMQCQANREDSISWWSSPLYSTLPIPLSSGNRSTEEG